MSGRKQAFVTLGFVLAASLIAAAVSALLAASYESRMRFQLLDGVCTRIVAQQPEAEKIVAAALKEYTGEHAGAQAGQSVLAALGYRRSDFSSAAGQKGMPALFVSIGFLAGMLLFFFTFFCRNRIEATRLRGLSSYLEQANMGRAAILSAFGEDDFGRLEDEIYKTVTFLYQTKDAAVQAKNEFAQNLSNIAHQMKTPITAVSLSVQMMKQGFCSGGLEQVEKQLSRLAHLEEALLLLSRIDAGTLYLQKQETDVFTLLVLAADHLQQLFAHSGMTIEVPELGEQMITADLDWTMEAVMNLMKNCMEHSTSKTVHCSYAHNPLYTSILVWDDGQGFAKEDLPHLFERFYRGKNAAAGGVGIGLALAKEIIERQNGTIRAKNRDDGGALFEIRFYCH